MKISYRPEIDGLRAIAVLSVIFYHAQVTFYGHNYFASGFIGVDIFFVISGYLITSIIFKELLTTGKFSFTYFYERRIRRILPVLFTVMLISLPAAWFLLLPSSLEDFSKSILYSLGFSSNFYFWFSNSVYGAESSLLKPFLHTWSLSIEEQFYVLFPIICIFLFTFFRRFLLVFFLLGLVISLGAADWGSKNYPSFNFYVLPTRAWELLAGTILAYLEITLGSRSKNQILNLTMPGLGLLLIILSIFFFNDKIFHPSFYTLLPIIGVCLIIWFSDKDDIVTQILSSKIFVGCGLISYSLYLWHYSVFAFVRIAGFPDSVFKKPLVGSLILLLSIASYYLIEKPARNKNVKFKKVFLALIFTIFLIVTFSFYTLKNDGNKTRSHFPKIVANTLETLDYRNNTQNGLRCSNRSGKDGFCIFNQLENNKGDIILLGDSLTDALLANFIDQISNTKFRLVHMSYSGNMYLPGFIQFNKINKKYNLNFDFHSTRENFINNKVSKNSYIVVFGDYNYYFFEKRIKFDENQEITSYETLNGFADKENINLEYEKRIPLLKNKFRETLFELSKKHKVILLYPSPVSPVNVPTKVNSNSIFNNEDNYYLKDKINFKKNIYEEYNNNIISFFETLNFKNIYKIKLKDVFCPNEQCFLYDKDKIFIFDNVHPSYEGSKLINDLIFSQINEIEKKDF